MQHVSMKSHLTAKARQTQRKIRIRLEDFQSQFGLPLPSYLTDDPALVILCRELVSLEYDVYGLDPQLDTD